MNLNFAAIIARLGAGFAFDIANQARAAADYLWATFLPEQNRATYQAKSGNMTIRATMAGLVGTDSPYPPTGVIETSDFSEQVAKVAGRVTLTEMTLRELQALIATLTGQEAANAELTSTVLNFTNKLLVQSHLDAFEWLRGQAFTTGAIDWTYNKKRLQVDYGFVAGNILTLRSGNDHYGGSASKFWVDMRSLRTKLKGQVRALIAHPDTIDLIIGNAVNAIRVIEQDNVTGTYTITKIVGSTEQSSSDARDRLTLIAYGLEGEILDPANPGKTKLAPFCPTGKIVAIGNPIPEGFRVGQGSTQSPQNTLPIGYTHLAPTVEGGGRPGRWADVRTPDTEPWQLEGRGVTNGLPVIEAPEKVAVARTDMA